MSPIAPAAAVRPLEEIASVRNGYAPRQLVANPFGEHRGLQVRDLATNADADASARVDWSRLMSPRVIGDASRYEVRDGDLVVSLRGAPRAWRITNPPERVIVVGQLAIVSPHPGAVDPDYLAWFLNHPATVSTLRALARGTSLSFVSMGELRQLGVQLPPLRAQRAIGRIAMLARAEERLLRQLADARLRLTDVRLLRVACTR